MPTWCSQCGRMISDVVNPGDDTESLCDGCLSVGLLEDDDYDDWCDGNADDDSTKCPLCGALRDEIGECSDHCNWVLYDGECDN